MSVRSLGNIEQGVVAEPKLVDVAAIAAVLGMTCADFLPTTSPPPPPRSPGRPAMQPGPPRPKGKRT